MAIAFNWLDMLLPIGAALFAALISSVTGGGVTIILLPVLVMHFGIHAAMPIVTIAVLTAGASRVAVYRREIDASVALWFTAGSLPFTALGTYLFTITAPDVLTRILGGFLIVAVLYQRLWTKSVNGFSAAWFLPIGAVFGFLTGVTAAVAAILAPFFLGYGLRKGAYVGSMGLNVFIIQIVKLAVFGSRDFLPPPVLLYGALLAPFMIGGTVLGKKLLERVSEALFVVLIEIVMVLAGLHLMVRGSA